MTGAQLPIWGDRRKPLGVRYIEWRQSVEGQEVANVVARWAVDQAAAGRTRISINALFEGLRAARGKSVNNSWRSFLAREILNKHPELAGKLRIKGKVAA